MKSFRSISVIAVFGLIGCATVVFSEEVAKKPITVSGGFNLIHYTDISQASGKAADVLPLVSLNPSLDVGFEKAWLNGAFHYELEYKENWGGSGANALNKTEMYNLVTLDLKGLVTKQVAVKLGDVFEGDMFPDAGSASGDLNILKNVVRIGPAYTFPFGTEVALQFANCFENFPSRQFDPGKAAKSMTSSQRVRYQVVEKGINSKTQKMEFAVPAEITPVSNITKNSVGGVATVSHAFPTKGKATAYYRYLNAIDANDPQEVGATVQRVQVVLEQPIGKKLTLGLLYRYERTDYASKTVDNQPSKLLKKDYHRFLPNAEYTFLDNLNLILRYDIFINSTNARASLSFDHEVSTGVGITF